jgi:putative FmdB family regulatory protein
MPTYDYQCLSCKKDFTAMHKISEAAPPCPECGAKDVKKKLSAPAVHGGGQKAAQPAPSCSQTGCPHRH